MRMMNLELGGGNCLIAEIGDHIDALLPTELRAIEAATKKRRLEYASGRWLARALLHEFGHYDYELLTGAHREPLWPSGVVGSITHSDTHAAVVVADMAIVDSIGIDLETRERVSQEFLGKLLTEREQKAYAHLDPTLVFSAKEACYKYLYPLIGSYVDYLDVEVELNMNLQSFELRYVGAHGIAAILERALGRFSHIAGQWFCHVSAVASDPYP